jgi:hypothetical protein
MPAGIQRPLLYGDFLVKLFVTLSHNDNPTQPHQFSNTGAKISLKCKILPVRILQPLLTIASEKVIYVIRSPTNDANSVINVKK